MPRFCARCGREESENIKIIGYLCQDCFLREKEIADVPRRISIEMCPVCGSIRIGDAWYPQEDFGGDLRIPVGLMLSGRLRPGTGLIERVEIRGIDIIERNGSLYAEISVEGVVGGAVLAKTYVSEIVVVRRICPLCISSRTGGYEAIVQVRGFPRLSERLSREISRYIEGLSQNIQNYISKIDRVRNGVDIRVISKRVAETIAHEIAERFGGVVARTSEEGVRYSPSGRVSKRVILVKIPDLVRGDYVNIKGMPYIVEDVAGDKIVVRDREGRTRHISIEELLKIIRTG